MNEGGQSYAAEGINPKRCSSGTSGQFWAWRVLPSRAGGVKEGGDGSGVGRWGHRAPEPLTCC